MKSKTKLFIFTMICYFVSIFLAESTFAQIQVYTKPDSCDFIYTISQRHFPPLQSDMPLDVLISWIVVDSVCKNATYDQIYARALATTVDSIRLGLKYLYKLQDYDPLLLGQYHYDLYNMRTSSDIGLIRTALLDAYKQKVGEISKPLLALYITDRIYHVQVASQSTFLKIFETSKDTGEIFCAELNVIEKIKGQRMYPTCQTLPSISTKKGIATEENNCIKVIWVRKILSELNSHQDTLINNKYSYNFLEVNKEYIVLLNNHIERDFVDHTTWLINTSLYPSLPLSSLRFPIENGNVVDEDNIFGFGTAIRLATFKTNIQNLINTFLGL